MIKGHHILNAITAAMIAALPLLTSSCIYDDDEPEINVGQPTMLARFIISVGNDQEGSTIRTKQTAAVTQAQSSPFFRGMQDIVMIPFMITGTDISDGDSRVGDNNVVLPMAGSIPHVDANNTINSLNTGSKSQVYQNVDITQGTNAFLCYGKATGDDNMANGSLVCTGLETGHPSDISFSPKAIYTPADPGNPTPDEATELTAYLTTIATTQDWDAVTHGKMKLLLESFKDQHAGSATNVLAVLQKLYDAICNDNTTLSNAIIANMQIGSGNNDKLHVVSGTTLAWNDNVTFKNYPASIGGTNLDLPDGAAYIAWSGGVNNCFITVINGNFDNVDNRPQGTDPETFAHSTEVDLMHYATPAPLYYRANTRIKVSNQSQLALYQDDTKDWDGVLDGYETDNGEVTQDTRSLALKDPLEYAIARLDAVIKTKENATTLKDNNDVDTDASDLELTGVLVNGQYPVDFEFAPILPTPPETPKPYIIYDNTIPPADANTDPITPITMASNIGKTSDYIVTHTLVLPSFEDEPVNIYFEFKNNSTHEIVTQRGVVPPGCKLYLPGTITPDYTNNEHYVFEQDHVTTLIATFTDLKNACNVVPPMDVVQSFTAQVAIKNWITISAEDHDLYNW